MWWTPIPKAAGKRGSWKELNSIRKKSHGTQRMRYGERKEKTENGSLDNGSQTANPEDNQAWWSIRVDFNCSIFSNFWLSWIFDLFCLLDKCIFSVHLYTSSKFCTALNKATYTIFWWLKVAVRCTVTPAFPFLRSVLVGLILSGASIRNASICLVFSEEKHCSFVDLLT